MEINKDSFGFPRRLDFYVRFEEIQAREARVAVWDFSEVVAGAGYIWSVRWAGNA